MKQNDKALAVWDDLKKGNQRFLQGKSEVSRHLSLQKLREFAETGQTPKAVVLCCSDSRAPVEMVFDQDIGDLFVIRVAGNVVAPSLVGSIEFATTSFGTSLVLVMGHTRCGAITATIDQICEDQQVPSKNLQDIVERIKPHVAEIAGEAELGRQEKIEKALRENVRASVKSIKAASPIIQELLAKNELSIIGSVLDISTGEVELLDQ